VDDNIRFFQPFILDDVSVKLGRWSGYNLLAQHRIAALSWLLQPSFRSFMPLTADLASPGEQTLICKGPFSGISVV
jgi:hypothetical protein